jgi:hypothetical protein
VAPWPAVEATAHSFAVMAAAHSLTVLAAGRGRATHSPDVDAATEDAARPELPARPPPWPLEAEEEDLPKMQDVVGDAYCANGYAYTIHTTHSTFCTSKMQDVGVGLSQTQMKL